MPLRCTLTLLALVALGISALPAQPIALSVNTASREEVRQFYRAVYFASENIPMTWTGNYAASSPQAAAGDTSAAFKEATRLRVNFYRALVGIPADITFNPAYSVKNQLAALMVSANNALDHFPPPTWTFYTADGAEAAGKSNLALGSAGPAAIDGYVADSGANNAAVGHRRWLFYPQTLRMGTGDVPGDATRPAANALWVIDTTPGGEFGSPRPPTRTTEITYPPAGFIPYTLVWPRWSFSFPGADFSAASVTMTRNGQPIPTTLEPLATGSGEPTLVWVYDNQNPNDDLPHPRPAADTDYTVNVHNVRLADGSVRTFTYQVTVFDPAVASPDAAPVAIAGSASPVLGASTSYTIVRPTFASAFDWRTVQLSSFNKTYSAETGLDGLLATTTPGYDIVQSSNIAAGSFAFRLAHLNPRSDQILRLPGMYLLSATSALTFQSRLAVATAIETARVQISLDDGVSWTDLFTQRGTSATDTAFPSPTEAAFVARNLPLGAFAGRTAALRLVYSIDHSGSTFVPEPANAVGWFIDNLALLNAQSVTAATPTRITNGTTFAFSPTVAGPVLLQARGVIAGAYPLDWGPVFAATAVSGDVPAGTNYLANLSVRTTAGAGDNTLIVGFAISGGNKPLLVRGIGPALAPFGVADALTNPKLELYTGEIPATKITENDDWLIADAPTFRSVGAFDLAPGSRDAAVVVTLPPATYTAHVSGNAGSDGIALLELYDTSGIASSARLANVFTRGRVGTGNRLLLAGFKIAGTGARTLLLRAIGPALTAFNVAGALADPKVELFDSANRLVAENDNWDATAEPTFARVGAFPLTRNSRDAVLLVTLPPGSYTAQISGVNNTTGVALVELYEVP